MSPPNESDRSNDEKMVVSSKGQLISKQDCRAITSPKKQTLDFYLQVYYFKHSESIEQLALNEVCVTVHLLLTAARRTPAVRASRRTVRASWLVSQYKGVAWTILGSVLTVTAIPNREVQGFRGKSL